MNVLWSYSESEFDGGLGLELCDLELGDCEIQLFLQTDQFDLWSSWYNH